MLLKHAFGLVVHADDVRRIGNVDVVQRNAVLLRQGADLLFLSGEENIKAVFLHRQSGALDNLQGSIVPSVSIHNDTHGSFPLSS